MGDYGDDDGLVAAGCLVVMIAVVAIGALLFCIGNRESQPAAAQTARIIPTSTPTPQSIMSAESTRQALVFAATREVIANQATATVTSARTVSTVNSIQRDDELQSNLYHWAIVVVKLLAVAVIVVYSFIFVLAFSRSWVRLNPNRKWGGE